MNDDLPPKVRVRCPECETENTVDREDAHDVLHTHDEKRHDGEQTAGLKVQTDDGFEVLPHPDDVATDGGSVQPDGGESGARCVDGTARCYNPLCEEELACDPGDKEGYCSWECAVMARSGQANRILREQREAGWS